MKISWTDTAIADLRNIKGFIAKDSPYYAARFVEKVLGAVENLESFPNIGRTVPEAGDPTIRELIFQHYRIIHKCSPSVIEVLTLLHEKRDISMREKQSWEIL